jgi:hypothetical protein
MPSKSLMLLAMAATAQAPPPLRLVREFTLDAGSGVTFGIIGGMDIGPDGSIALVDNGNGVIYRFFKTGKLRDSLGHRGQGPGEFLSSAGLSIGPAGEVALVDIRTRRITVWNPDGGLRGSAPVTGGMPIELIWRGQAPIVGVMTFSPGVGASASFGPVTMGDQATMGAAIATFPDPRREEFATAVSCGMCRRAISPDGKLLGAAPDTIYRISEIGPDGRAVRSWKRTDAGAGLRTPEEVSALEKRLASGPGGGRPNPEGRPGPVIPRGDIRYRPRVQGFGFDASGRLLALVSNAGSTRPVVDVFSGDGKFLGTVRPAEHLTAFAVRGARVIGLSESADGEHVVHVYRIEEVP